MAMLKLNKLHLHLVDGNGWRLEIKKYPRLTEIGAWRVARESDFSQRKNAQPEEPTPVGGLLHTGRHERNYRLCRSTSG